MSLPLEGDRRRTTGWELVWDGKRERAPADAGIPVDFRLTDAFDGPPEGSSLFDTRDAGFRGRLLLGDNLPAMEALLPELRGRIDLVYIDPPFLAGQEFTARVPLGEDDGMGDDRGPHVEVTAYRDTGSEAEYLQMLHERLTVLRELLSDTGSLIVHVNWRVGHLVQALLDQLFGPGERRGAGRPGFRCEIVWGFGGGGAPRNVYSRKHDNLFWYTKSDRWTFNPAYRPYTEKTRERGLTAVKGPQYALRDEGAVMQTWWTDAGVQKILSPTARENLKFPTQKPEALLERILRVHSDPDDLVADFFCGSGTTGAVAERLGRRWIMADQSSFAIHLARKRLARLQAELAAGGQAYRSFDLYRPDREDADASGVLRVTMVRHPDDARSLQLVEFTPELPAGAPAPVRETGDGPDYLDYWAVDFQYGAVTDGRGRPVFQHQWHSARLPGSRRIRLQSAAYRSRLGLSPAVKAVDLFGREYLARATEST